MDMGRVIAIQPIYANPTQPNPWVDPTHVHVWSVAVAAIKAQW